MLKYSRVPLPSWPIIVLVSLLPSNKTILSKQQHTLICISWKHLLVFLLFLKTFRNTLFSCTLNCIFFCFWDMTTREIHYVVFRSFVSFTIIPYSLAKYRNPKEQNTSDCQGTLWLTAAFPVLQWLAPQSPLCLNQGCQWSDPRGKIGLSSASWFQGECKTKEKCLNCSPK